MNMSGGVSIVIELLQPHLGAEFMRNRVKVKRGPAIVAVAKGTTHQIVSQGLIPRVIL